MTNFSVDISQWVGQVKEKLEQVGPAVAAETMKRIQDRTPVDTGALKAAWTQTADGDKITISNDLPYVGVVEYGRYPSPPKRGTGKTSGGFSTQAPAGMVGITFEEMPQIVEQVVKELA